MDVRRVPRLLFLVTLILGVIVPFSHQCPCKDLGADHFCSILTNGTGRFVVLPNFFKEHSLTSAKNIFTLYGLHQPHPLSGCSEYVDWFLCSLYFPHCRAGSAGGGDCQQLLPCRELCERVNSDCKDEVENLKKNHPDLQLPEVNCTELATFQEVNGRCVVHVDEPTRLPTAATGLVPDGSESTTTDGQLCGSPRVCTDGFVQRTGSVFADIRNCAEPCPGVLTSTEENDFATAWLSVWSALCLLFSVATIVCWVISYRSYHYPLTPILHIAICYAALALTYVLALATGRQSICYFPDGTGGANVSSVAGGKFSGGLCTFTFFTGYFFTVASWCWWIVIAVTWFLQAPLKFQGSSTERKGLQVLYHVVSWGVPLVLTVSAMATQSYEANSITRLCQISVHNSGAQYGFVVAPQLLAVAVCMVLLLFGHLKMLIPADSSKRSKQTSPPPQQHQQQNQNNKEWSLVDLIKADVFCVVFLVQMTVSSSVNMYHVRSLPEWEKYHIACDRCNENECNSTASTAVRPLFGVLMLKLSVELLMGCLLFLWLKPRAVLNGWKAMFKCLSKSDSHQITTPSTPTTPTWSQTSV